MLSSGCDGLPTCAGGRAEIYEVIIAIESMAAELLAARSQEERRLVANELEEATARMEVALRKNDLLAWAAADDLFNRTLVERCGNGRIRRIAQTVTDQAHRARMLTLKLRSKPTGSIAAHRRIIAAIQKGRVAEAIAMRGNIASAPAMNSFR